MGKFTHETDITGYNILSNEDLDALHESTLQLLEDYGLQMHGKEALDILAGAGCEVDYENDRVKFPRNLVNDAIEKCPAEFTLCGRDPAKDTVVGGKKVAYKNFGTGVFIFDPYTGELRESTKEDLGNVARFIDAIPEIDVFSIAVTAGDVNQKVRSLHEAEVVFNNLTKNFAHDLEGVKNTQRFIDMAAAIQGGYDKLRERPIVAMAPARTHHWKSMRTRPASSSCLQDMDFLSIFCQWDFAERQRLQQLPALSSALTQRF